MKLRLSMLTILLMTPALSASMLPAISSSRVPQMASRPSLVHASSDGQLANIELHTGVHGAMPLFSIEASNQSLAIHHTALRALAALPAPICVLSVSGGPHEGKSSFLNMFSHWLGERWPTEGPGDAAPNFYVGNSIFDTGTEGAWLRVFTGKGVTRPSKLSDPPCKYPSPSFSSPWRSCRALCPPPPPA